MQIMDKISEEVLAVDRGLVLTLQLRYQAETEGNHGHDTPTSSNRSKFITYSYNQSLTKFVKCGECNTDVSRTQIISCSVVEDYVTGTILPCLLIKTSGNNESESNLKQNKVRNISFQYKVVFLISDQLKLVKVGSFSCDTSLSQCKVWLLDGPTICWEENECLNVTKMRTDKTGIFQTEQLLDNSWSSEHCLHWCCATKNNVVVIATHPARDEPSSSDRWLDDTVGKKKWVVLLCERQDIGKVLIVETPIIPNLYASIVNSLFMAPKVARSLNCNNVNHSSTRIIATTNMGQLLMFSGGKVQHVCDLPFRDASTIQMVSRANGGDLVVVKSQSAMVCAVECKSFKIVQQWESACSVYVDDFLFNGSEQMLILQSASTTQPLKNFILTDLDTCFISDKEREETDELAGDLACSDSLVSAVRALEARLQSAQASFMDAENKCRERSQLIEQSQQSLCKMVMGEDNMAAKNDQKHLSCLYNGSVQQENNDDQRNLMMESNGTESYQLDILDVWQRVIDSKWIVGVTVKNKSNRKMEDVCISLVPTNITNWHCRLEPVTSQCVGVNLPGHSDVDTEENSKLTRPTKRARGSDALESVRLSPEEKTDIVTVSALPEFSRSKISCDVVLNWKEWNKAVGPGGKNSDGGCWIDKVKSCGRVELTAADVVSGQLGILLVSSQSKSGKELHQDNAAMNASQMSTCLHVTTLHSSLSCMLEVLTSKLGFHPWCAMHDGLVCSTSSVLWGVRVRLSVQDYCHGKLTVWTRDKTQLMIFIQGLYHHLPDDVTIQSSSPNSNQIEGAITHSIQSMKQELATHVTSLGDLQTTSTVNCEDDDVVVMETDTESGINDAARKMSDVRRKFKAEQLQLKDGGSVVISKENLRTITINSSNKKEKTDSAVRTLSSNVKQVS